MDDASQRGADRPRTVPSATSSTRFTSRSRVSKQRMWLAAAIVTSFFAFDIVCTTIVQRWHYAVDVIAGLALAFAAWCAPRLQGIESRLRGRAGLQPAWSFKAE